VQRVRSGIGDIRATVDRQDAVRVGVVFLVRDVGRVVEAKGADAGDVAPGAVRLHGEEGTRLLLGGVDIRRASGVAGGAGEVRERLREDALDCQQLAATCGDAIHAEGFARAGSAELGYRKQLVDQRSVRPGCGVHPRDLRAATETGERV